MRSLLPAVLLVLAGGAFAGDELGKLYDGAPSRREARFDAPRPPSPEGVAAERAPTPVPPELAAAKARVGVDAQLAKLGATAPRDSFAFGVVGDAEPGRFPWERVFSPGPHVFEEQMRSLQASAPDFVLQLGDFVSEGIPENYAKHVAWADAEAKVPLLRCPGNHDRSRPNGDADKDLYDAVFGPRDYFFDRGGWRFIALDSSDRKVTPAQLAWLKAALDSPARKVVFTHVPPKYLKDLKPLAEVGALETDSRAYDETVEKSGGVHDFFTNYFEDGAPEFEALVSSPSARVTAVYMGHIHAFWAADHRGVRYVISGGGGSPLYPLPPGYPKKKFAHVLWVEASPAGLRETVRPFKGAPFVLPPVRP